MTTELKPMDPEQLASIREGVEWRRERPQPSDDHRDAIIAELLADRDYQEKRADDLGRAVDGLLAELLGKSVRPDERIDACNQAKWRAVGFDDPVLVATRERARVAEHRVAGLCAANADCYRRIADLRKQLGIVDDIDFSANADSLDRTALRIVERERDEARLSAAEVSDAAKLIQADLAVTKRRAWEAEAEVARLRSRVRVEAEDVERAGVTWAHVVAWLAAKGWTTPKADRFGWLSSCNSTNLDQHDLARDEGSEAERVAMAVDYLAADVFNRPGLDILGEMAAIETSKTKTSAQPCP